jgi:hypothetical protein
MVFRRALKNWAFTFVEVPKVKDADSNKEAPFKENVTAC